jgi:hypothetical protein
MHYESSGMTWDKGEKPECNICGKLAKWETAHSGIVLCNKPKCHSEYIRDISAMPIELVKDS